MHAGANRVNRSSRNFAPQRVRRLPAQWPKRCFGKGHAKESGNTSIGVICAGQLFAVNLGDRR